MVTAELKAEDIFSPNKLAETEIENKTIQKSTYIPFNSKMLFPIIMKRNVCMAEMMNNIDIFDSK